MNMTRKMIVPAMMIFALVSSTAFAADNAEQQNAPSEGMAEATAENTLGPCGPCGPGMRGKQYSPEQQKKYEAITAEFTARVRPLQEAMFVKKHELIALEHAAQPDLRAVEKIAKELYALRVQLADIHKEWRTRIIKEIGHPMVEPRGKHKGPHRDKHAHEHMPMDPMHNHMPGLGHY